MDSNSIRIIAAVLAVMVLAIIIWRRKRKTIEYVANPRKYLRDKREAYVQQWTISSTVVRLQ
jgi:uncharacterized protein (DUF2384 family)